jgi:predicted O-methyltransferase YrrM
MLFKELARHEKRFEDLFEASQNPVGFSFCNGFFTSPDAEVLYCMIRHYKPRTIVEVGSGNSTKICRLALMDGDIDSELISIDPQPRADIDALTDRAYRTSVESMVDLSVFSELGENDVLFIDSSHELRPGNDLTHLYLCVLPILASGVLVHIHDIFLPYDYRPDWILNQRLPYTEQYLVQTMLQSEGTFKVIWPGYYLQRTLADFADRFPNRKSGDAQSLWLMTR